MTTAKVIQIEVDPASAHDPVADDIARVEQTLATAGLEEPLGTARGTALQSFRDNFNSQASATGQSWPPRKNPGDGHPLLMESGALLQAVTGGGAGHITRIEPRALELGVNLNVRQGGIPGGRAHHFGYKALPARPFHDVSDAHQETIEEQLADDLLEML